MMSREAMKLALEALEMSHELDDTGYADAKKYGLASDEDITEKLSTAITALRKALANEALDKKAENARELGLDYEPAQQEPLAWMLEWTFNGEERGCRLYDDERHCISDAESDGGVCRPLYASPPPQQEPVSAIRALTDQCFALIQERDELQKQVWRYEKNGVTCQTYRHKVDASCSECNVHEVYTSPPAQQKPVAWLIEFENGEQELHFEEQSVGETHTPLYKCQPAQRKPLTEDWIRARCGQPWVFEAAKKWVRLTEAAHNIKENT